MLAAITIDVDWAPDFAIDWVADRLIERSVPATWFVTHQSEALERLRRRPDLFELGIHPNFAPGSTHGSGTSDVLRHCLAIVPRARIMRTHQLVQSTPLLMEVIKTTGILADCSLYLPHASAAVPTILWYEGRPLVRIPYIWEDDFEVEQPHPAWRLHEMADLPLRVFGFHPIHLFLNSISMIAYRQLKMQFPILSNVTFDDALNFVNEGTGPRTMLDDLLGLISSQPGKRLFDVVEQTLAQ
jgi:hypothetical protein